MTDLNTVLIQGVLATRHEYLVRERREHRFAKEIRTARRRTRRVAP